MAASLAGMTRPLLLHSSARPFLCTQVGFSGRGPLAGQTRRCGGACASIQRRFGVGRYGICEMYRAVARDAKEGVMASLADFEAMVPRENGLAVLTVIGPDGRMRPSVVNVGVLDHPITGEPAVAAVIHGRARKLAHLRARPRASVVLRAGWQWAGVEGPVQIAGPDDPMEGIDAERLRLLLREIFTAAGGTHEDFDEFDKVMAQERRAAVLIAPERVFTNG